jgi:hypothetical protein
MYNIIISNLRNKMQGVRSEPVVSLDNILSYINDLNKHQREISKRQNEVADNKIEEYEAEKLNT